MCIIQAGITVRRCVLLVIVLHVGVVLSSAQSSVFLGEGAGNGTTLGSENTSIGYLAGDVVTGNGNTSLGAHAGRVLTSGMRNVFLGYAAGRQTTTAGYNVFIGSEAGFTNNLGTSNVFIGNNSGYSNTSGQQNTFLGAGAGYSNTIGLRNTYTGQSSGSTSTASDNTFYGYYSGRLVTTGNQNTIVGTSAGSTLTTGAGNVFLGYQAGANETGSSRLYIENSNAAVPLVYGDFSTDKVGINALPIGTHTLTVGGTIHSTGLFVDGLSVGPSFWQHADTRLYNLDYNVGIGKANPTQKLDVGGVVNADAFHVNGVLVVSSQWVSGGANVYYDGGVGIGTTLANNPNNYKLAVKGGIGAYDVRVEKTSATWPDYVFKPGYRLPPLAEVESFIQEHGHLEDVPSAPEVERNGHSVGDMDAVLLKKVEELTLYIIQLRKEVDALKAAQKDK